MNKGIIAIIISLVLLAVASLFYIDSITSDVAEGINYNEVYDQSWNEQ